MNPTKWVKLFLQVLVEIKASCQGISKLASLLMAVTVYSSMDSKKDT